MGLVPLTALLLMSTPISASGPTTIYRDATGVPSIVASSYMASMQALGYLHFTDCGERAALNYKIARGRSGEVLGRGQQIVDTFLRGFEFEERADAAQLSDQTWRDIDAYIDGANRAIAEQKGKLPAWVQPITRTDILCLVQFINSAFPLLDLSSELMPGVGSNQFAVGPKRSATGHPVLSIDPHLDWNGADGGIVWYESAMYTPHHSFRGVSVPGAPGFTMGHSDRIAYSMTNNDPQLFVRYTVKTNPDDPSQYLYHGEWKPFRTKTTEMRFLDNGKLSTSTATLKMTEWGPMVPFRSESVLLEPVGNFRAVEQLRDMAEAKDVGQLRDALGQRGTSMWNYVFADVDGNISYQYNATLARRDPQFDWGKPVPGDIPETKLGTLLSLDELPHITNPTSNLLINANSAPWLTPVSGGIPTRWPSYISTYGPTTRSARLTDLLKGDSKISIEAAKRIATDTEVPFWRRAVDRLRASGATGQGMDILNRWDGRAEIDSVGTALFLTILSHEAALTADTDPGTARSLAAYQAGCDMLTRQFGRLSVKWGEVLQMKRGTIRIGASGWGGFVPGGYAAVNPSGTNGRISPLKMPLLVNRGSSFRMIVSLEPGKVRSWSILPYGNATDPSSPFYANQMRQFAVGRYKETRFGVDSAKADAVSSITLR